MTNKYKRANKIGRIFVDSLLLLLLLGFLIVPISTFSLFSYEQSNVLSEVDYRVYPTNLNDENKTYRDVYIEEITENPETTESTQN